MDVSVKNWLKWFEYLYTMHLNWTNQQEEKGTRAIFNEGGWVAYYWWIEPTKVKYNLWTKSLTFFIEH